MGPTACVLVAIFISPMCEESLKCEECDHEEYLVRNLMNHLIKFHAVSVLDHSELESQEKYKGHLNPLTIYSPIRFRYFSLASMDQCRHSVWYVRPPFNENPYPQLLHFKLSWHVYRTSEVPKLLISETLINNLDTNNWLCSCVIVHVDQSCIKLYRFFHKLSKQVLSKNQSN